jgi:hypothetical protein
VADHSNGFFEGATAFGEADGSSDSQPISQQALRSSALRSQMSSERQTCVRMSTNFVSVRRGLRTVTPPASGTAVHAIMHWVNRGVPEQVWSRARASLG